MRVLAALALLGTVAVQGGEIRGVVVSAQGGEPLPGVEMRLTLAASETNAARTLNLRTGAAGAFFFEDLPAGSYTLSLSKSGFEAGSSVRQSVILADPDQKLDLNVELRRSAVIAGRVLDPDGDPLADADIQLRVWNTSMGRRTMSTLERIQTDDLGEYRLHGLAPGKYIVRAAPMNLRAAQGVLAFEFGGLYHPQAGTVEEAVPIRLGWGDERTDIDFTLPGGRPTSIEGMVLGADGVICRRCMVGVSSAGGSSEGNVGVTDGGLFAIRGLPPGQYELTVFAGRDGGGAFAEVPVSESKPAEVILTMSEGLTVSGRVTIDGTLAPDQITGPAMVSLRSSSFAVSRGRMQASVDLAAAGDFVISDISPGIYSISAGNLPAGAYVDRILASGRPLPDGVVNLRDGQSALGLELRLALDGGTISGSVENPQPGGIVVLLPDRYGQAGRYEMLASYRPDEGMLQFTGVPPGSYRLFALPGRNAFDLGDAEDLAFLRSKGRKVTVSARAEAQADAPFIPSLD